MNLYKIEPKKPSGRFVLATYDQGLLVEIKLCGEGWIPEMVKYMFEKTPPTESFPQETKLNFIKI